MNKITILDAKPVPNPDAIFAKICNSKYFSKIDLSKGYWQIPISNADGEKTAFVCEHGLFEFVRMPFGLVNSGATFCRLMRKIFKNMDNVVNYIDDLLIYTDTWEDHIRVLSEVFHKLSEANLTARPSKCSFASDNVSFLGHDIGENKIYPQDNKIKKIKDFVRPATKKQLRSFLGLCNYYSNFVKNFAEIAAPLTSATGSRQGNMLNWTDEMTKSFEELKQKLICKPILRLPDVNKSFNLQCDASEV